MSQDEDFEDEIPKSLFELPGNESFKSNLDEFKEKTLKVVKPLFSSSTNLPTFSLFTNNPAKVLPSFLKVMSESEEQKESS